MMSQLVVFLLVAGCVCVYVCNKAFTQTTQGPLRDDLQP